MTFKINQNQGGAGDRVPSTNRDLLEQSRLSRLPQRTPFKLPDFDEISSKNTTFAVCAGCGAKLDLEDSIQKRFTGCRKCIGIFGRLSFAVEESERRERQGMLEKMIGGANE